jgi:hypothetical protein
MLPATILLAALTSASPPHLRATPTQRAPVVDGRLDDEVWKQAEATDAYTQKFPNEGEPPSDPTVVRILYDHDSLYIGVECRQMHSPLVQRLTRRGRKVESDWVSVGVRTRGDGKSAFEFIVNASGVLVDGLRFNDTDYAGDWDENWEAFTAVTPTGWSAEIRIPLHILRFPSRAEQSWDLQFRRYISERQETDEWAFIPRDAGGEVSHYGKLDNLIGLEASSPLELRPFVLGRYRRRDAATDSLASGTDLSASIGLDLKWHPTYDLTLDATFHPDFAQVEADQLVLNLTKFETYYPEKRPFFLEAMDVFTTPIQLVYTRRIGRVPLAPSRGSSRPGRWRGNTCSESSTRAVSGRRSGRRTRSRHGSRCRRTDRSSSRRATTATSPWFPPTPPRRGPSCASATSSRTGQPLRRTRTSSRAC